MKVAQRPSSPSPLPVLLPLLVLSATALPAQRIDPAQRKDAQRTLALGRPEVANAVLQGLEWLKRHQSEDGRWDADGFMAQDPEDAPTDGAGNPARDVGVTALSLLAFAGAGHEGSADNAYGRAVAKGLAWLLTQQGKDGLVGAKASHDFVYDHALATLALCEHALLSDDPALKQAAQAGIDYLESHRNPYAVWRYQPRDGDNDTSITAWATQAYAAATDLGLQVPDKARSCILGWLDQVTDPKTGRCGYSRRGGPSARMVGAAGPDRFPPEEVEAMTAASLLCRFLLGQDASETGALAKGAELLLARPPRWDEETGAIDHIYWYFGSQAMHQVGGEAEEQWFEELHAAVLPHQRKDGSFLGSWDPAGPWGHNGGRVYSTAMLMLALLAPQRLTANK